MFSRRSDKIDPLGVYSSIDKSVDETEGVESPSINTNVEGLLLSSEQFDVASLLVVLGEFTVQIRIINTINSLNALLCFVPSVL